MSRYLTNIMSFNVYHRPCSKHSFSMTNLKYIWVEEQMHLIHLFTCILSLVIWNWSMFIWNSKVNFRISIESITPSLANVLSNTFVLSHIHAIVLFLFRFQILWLILMMAWINNNSLLFHSKNECFFLILFKMRYTTTSTLLAGQLQSIIDIPKIDNKVPLSEGGQVHFMNSAG